MSMAAARIGMRRLSIIDLSTGHQPISNEDGSVWVVFNGEIYNYQELRADLHRAGHRFATNSDTETLVHLYEQEGVEGLARLRGMFAFRDLGRRRKQQLLLVRDRFGKKPLYYTSAVRATGLYFASELKCLRAAGVPLEDRPRSAAALLPVQLHSGSAYGVSRRAQAAAGGWLDVPSGSGAVRQGRYWRMPAPAEQPAAGATTKPRRASSCASCSTKRCASA